MGKILVLSLAFLLLLSLSVALGEVTVGVKEGDWIEYTVATTGLPEEGHDVVWARMEILDVQGKEIIVNVTTEAANRTVESDIMTMNPEEGQVGVWFIIPANLDVGDSFYDASMGNVTIEGLEQKTFAGATRTVTHASTPERIKYWDKATGVFIESIDILPNYTLNATADKTNMWSPQLLGIDPTIVYAASIGVAIVIVIAIATAAIMMRRQKR